MTDSDVEDSFHSSWEMVKLILVAVIAGALVGVIGGFFRHLLSLIATHLPILMQQLNALGGYWVVLAGLVTALVAAGLMGIARALVKLEPSTMGSGIQHVEAVMSGEARPSRLRALPIKFFGGLLSIGSGMALGKEGPTVQIAAVIGSECGRFSRLKAVEQSLLYTAVAGAGLSVAFNAPLSGIAFSIEEIAKKVSVKRVIVAFAAVTAAMIVFRRFFGDAIEFSVGDIVALDGFSLLCYAAFSVLLSFRALLEIQNLRMKCKAHGAQKPECTSGT